MTLTVIIIDDSPLMRMTTSRLVNDNPNLKLIGCFSDPSEGLEAVNRLQPDVLFLDVEMPVLNGFNVIEQLNCDCQVILNSTRQEFALMAFQYFEVKDYLSKPMKKSRFELSIDRAVKNQWLKNKERSIASVPVYTERLPIAS